MNAPIAETCLWKNADFDITDPRLAQSVAGSLTCYDLHDSTLILLR